MIVYESLKCMVPIFHDILIGIRFKTWEFIITKDCTFCTGPQPYNL